jgi:secreted trypsin-like serine protease
MKNGRWYAAGVVSYANGCGLRAFPTVFTKTAAYIDWIRDNINRLA